MERTNSASHFEFKLRERAPWDGDKNLRGARTKRGKKVAKGLRLKLLILIKLLKFPCSSGSIAKKIDFVTSYRRKNLISEAKFPVANEPYPYLQHIQRIGANSQY